MKKNVSIVLLSIVSLPLFAMDAEKRNEPKRTDWKWFGGIDKVQVLIQAWPEAVYGAEGVPIILASAERYPAIVKALLDAGANPDQLSDIKSTALMSAASYGYTDIAKILLEAGANPHYRMPGGLTETAREIAKSLGKTETAQLIKEYEMKPKHWDSLFWVRRVVQLFLGLLAGVDVIPSNSQTVSNCWCVIENSNLPFLNVFIIWRHSMVILDALGYRTWSVKYSWLPYFCIWAILAL